MDKYQQFVGQILVLIYQTKWHHIQTLQYVLGMHKEYPKSNGHSVVMGMYVGNGLEDCVAGHMSWLNKCFEDNYI
jgi:hypothetical protein